MLDALCKVKGVPFPGLEACIDRPVMSLVLLPFATTYNFRILLKNAGHIGILIFLGRLTGHIPARHQWLTVRKFGPYPLIEEITSLDDCIFCNYHLLAPSNSVRRVSSVICQSPRCIVCWTSRYWVCILLECEPQLTSAQEPSRATRWTTPAIVLFLHVTQSARCISAMI